MIFSHADVVLDSGPPGKMKNDILLELLLRDARFTFVISSTREKTEKKKVPSNYSALTDNSKSQHIPMQWGGGCTPPPAEFF